MVFLPTHTSTDVLPSYRLWPPSTAILIAILIPILMLILILMLVLLMRMLVTIDLVVGV